MYDDVDEIFGGLEDDETDSNTDDSSTEDVADFADALTDLEASEQENPDLAAQFFGDTPFDFGTPSPLSQEDAEQPTQQSPESDAGVWGDILEEAREGVGSITMQSPAFRSYLEERAASAQPVIEQRRAKAQWRDWQIDFGPVSAPAGETLRVFETPQVPFRGEKLMATDTASPAGTGTMITTITVGQLLQRPANTFSLTAFFSQLALGNGVKFDTAVPFMRITIGISFIQACTFMMSLFGKALIAEE